MARLIRSIIRTDFVSIIIPKSYRISQIRCESQLRSNDRNTRHIYAEIDRPNKTQADGDELSQLAISLHESDSRNCHKDAVMGAATVIEVPRARMGANLVRSTYSVIIAVPTAFGSR